MTQFNPHGIELKVFVRERSSDASSESDSRGNATSRYLTTNRLTGDTARKFYEDVVGGGEAPSQTGVQKRVAVPIKRRVQLSREVTPKAVAFTDRDLLRLAQNNDVANLTACLSQAGAYDVNVTDDFGWTPLMCAACSGAKEAVEILLEHGADTGARDKSGFTALKLAKRKRFQGIVTLLEEAQNKGQSPGQAPEECTDKPAQEPFFCDICKDTLSNNKRQHETSTVHQFNCKHKTSIFYGIPESNKGFQLLLKEGWNKEEGLGPDGHGRKFPVKAVPKKNRRGIGAPDPPKRKASSDYFDYTNKELNLYNRRKEKQFEKRFRLEFA